LNRESLTSSAKNNNTDGIDTAKIVSAGFNRQSFQKIVQRNAIVNASAGRGKKQM